MKYLRFAIVAAVVLFVFIYWAKCQDGIDLIPSFHLSKTVPFNYLKQSQKIVYATDGKVILKENFDGFGLQNKWDKIWAREQGLVAERISPDGKNKSKCLVIQSSSDQDWSVQSDKLVEVKPGDVFYYEGKIRTQGNSRAGFSVILYDENKKIMAWLYGQKTVQVNSPWQGVHRKFMILPSVKYIRFRFTGSGRGESFADDIVFGKDEKSYSITDLKETYEVNNTEFSLSIDPMRNSFSFRDKKNDSAWDMSDFFGSLMIVSADVVNQNMFSVKAVMPEDLMVYLIQIKADIERRSFSVELNCETDSDFEGVTFPVFRVTDHRASFVLPSSEGMLMPLDDYVGRTGSYMSGRPLPFIGVVKENEGLLVFQDTPVDAALALNGKQGDTVLIQNQWLPQKGSFGYPRKLTVQLIEQGGYVGIAKAARRRLMEHGFLTTLKDKNPLRNNNISKLIGAVDIWYFGGKDQHWLIEDLKKSGIQKALISSASEKLDIEDANRAGFLSSQYDIYQDVWSPDVANANHIGWPDALVLDRNGDWIKGWSIKRDSKVYPGGVICSIEGLRMAKEKLPLELKTKTHTARFVDTVTSTPWRECYSKIHPTTRTEDMTLKMKLLGFYSSERHLVTGSEDGAYAAIPSCDYFEGMMSPGIGRLPGSGRNVAEVKYIVPTENFTKYQVGTKYRIPLWELVFHDCAISTWYWGDSSNRAPEVWDRRDLFNILYGNMPLWAIPDYAYWEKYKKRFLECYHNVSPVFEKVGFEEMLSHQFLTDDHDIQETTFSNNVRVVVNFGDEAFRLDDRVNLPAKGFVVFENGAIWKQGVCTRLEPPNK